MAKIRNVSNDARMIAVGLQGRVWVEPDATVTIPDDVLELYSSQIEIWAVEPEVSSPPPVPVVAPATPDEVS